jgi:hypothetical protein
VGEPLIMNAVTTPQPQVLDFDPAALRDAEVAILSGGVGELLIAARLREAGISDIVAPGKRAG